MSATAIKGCAAHQAHRQLAKFASFFLRSGREELRQGMSASAQTRFELAADLLALTSRLHVVLTGTLLEPWDGWLADLRHAANVKRWPGHLSATEAAAKVLLERMLVVRWGDAGAMLQQSLPRLSRQQERAFLDAVDPPRRGYEVAVMQ